MSSSIPNATTWTDTVNVLQASATVLNVAAKAGLGNAAPAEVVSAATGLLSAVSQLEEAPGMQSLSKISGLTSGVAALTVDIPALQKAINESNAAEIALNVVKVTADSCGTVGPLATGAAAVADANPATIGELGAPLTTVAAAMDTCAATTGALAAAVESGKTILNTTAAIQQYLDDANTDLMNGFINDPMDYLITGSAVGVPGSDLIGNGASINWKTASGALDTIGFNDTVDASEFAGKGGDPLGAGVSTYGGVTSISVGGLVDSGFSVNTRNATRNAASPTSGSSVFANGNSGVDLNISGGAAYDTSFVQNVGTGSTIVLNISNDTLSSLSAGSAVSIAASTTLDKVDASGEAITIGNGADAVVDGTGNGINAGSSSKVDDDGTGNVVTTSDATVYVAANDSVVVDGSGDRIVAAGSDHITDAGTGDAIYADNSSITFSGANSGDVVHGNGDTGTNWGGYVGTGGTYGGYGGGGYAAVAKTNLNAARLGAGQDIGSIATSMSPGASAASSNIMSSQEHNSGESDIANRTEISQETAALYGVKSQPSGLPLAVHAAASTASLVQSMAAWGSFTSAFSSQDMHRVQSGALDSNGLASPRTSVAHDVARHGLAVALT